MPLYYFQFTNATHFFDGGALDLPDDQAAKRIGAAGPFGSLMAQVGMWRLFRSLRVQVFDGQLSQARNN
jgi:hypothetical protein